jgi:hypothetical protein
MDRRTLLGLAACLPVVSAVPAVACSPALKNPRLTGVENGQVLRLFDAWFDRDVTKFHSYFTDRLMADGTPTDPKLAVDLMAFDPVPPHAYDIFNQFFTDRDKFNRVTLILNTDAAIIVGCAEADPKLANDQGDCSGLPKLHLFAVKMSGANPRFITHISTVATPEVDKFGIWTSGSA